MAWCRAGMPSRSVGRNLRRTVLSVVGIAIGCVLALFMESLNRGRGELFARAGASSGSGTCGSCPAGWRERRDPRLRLADWQADLDAARALPGVASRRRAVASAGAAGDGHARRSRRNGGRRARRRAARRSATCRRCSRAATCTPANRQPSSSARAIADRLSADLDDDIVATAVGPSGDIRARCSASSASSAPAATMPTARCARCARRSRAAHGFAGAGEVALVLRRLPRRSTRRARSSPRASRSGDEVMTLSRARPGNRGAPRAGPGDVADSSASSSCSSCCSASRARSWPPCSSGGVSSRCCRRSA